MFERAEAFAVALRRDLERGRRAAQALLKPDCPVSAALTEADEAALNKMQRWRQRPPPLNDALPHRLNALDDQAFDRFGSVASILPCQRNVTMVEQAPTENQMAAGVAARL